MGRIVIQHVIEEALVAAIIDCGEDAEGAVIELIGGHISDLQEGQCDETSFALAGITKISV